MLCNRGLNGIDGTVSTALGAAQHFEQTTLLTGDLTLLHDLNALALQRELRVQRASGGLDRSIVIAVSYTHLDVYKRQTVPRTTRRHPPV